LLNLSLTLVIHTRVQTIHETGNIKSKSKFNLICPTKCHCFALPLVQFISDEPNACPCALYQSMQNSSSVFYITIYYNLLIGHNLIFCAQLNYCSAQDIISGSVNRLVNKYRPTSKLVKDYQLQTASFVREIILIREKLPNRVSLSRLALDQLVHVISTSLIVTL